MQKFAIQTTSYGLNDPLFNDKNITQYHNSHLTYYNFEDVIYQSIISNENMMHNMEFRKFSNVTNKLPLSKIGELFGRSLYVCLSMAEKLKVYSLYFVAASKSLDKLYRTLLSSDAAAEDLRMDGWRVDIHDDCFVFKTINSN